MITVERNKTALLVMDLQSEIVTMFGDKAPPLLERTAGLVAAARTAGLPIVYVVVGCRPGYPELNPKNATFAAIAKSGRFIMSEPPAASVAPEVRPHDGDVVVVKRRVNAFFGTDLDLVLRAKGVDTLVLTGLSTSGVVLSTVRYGADSDYKLVVVKDCCADPDEEVHRVLTEKVFVRQATVTSAAELIAAL
ncbi:MAG TPA: isochorismatase family cysteine hydrolase [Polyangia bacterium]|jgi:nicotinamidase-related amidase